MGVECIRSIETGVTPCIVDIHLMKGGLLSHRHISSADKLRIAVGDGRRVNDAKGRIQPERIVAGRTAERHLVGIRRIVLQLFVADAQAPFALAADIGTHTR